MTVAALTREQIRLLDRAGIGSRKLLLGTRLFEQRADLDALIALETDYEGAAASAISNVVAETAWASALEADDVAVDDHLTWSGWWVKFVIAGTNKCRVGVKIAPMDDDGVYDLAGGDAVELIGFDVEASGSIFVEGMARIGTKDIAGDFDHRTVISTSPSLLATRFERVDADVTFDTSSGIAIGMTITPITAWGSSSSATLRSTVKGRRSSARLP
jgi:hypothetical protein